MERRVHRSLYSICSLGQSVAPHTMPGSKSLPRRTESGFCSRESDFWVPITSPGRCRRDDPCNRSIWAICLLSLASVRGELRCTGDIGMEITALVVLCARSHCLLLAFNVARSEFNMTAARRNVGQRCSSGRVGSRYCQLSPLGRM